jgi:shikimate 5-dehydrogenase
MNAARVYFLGVRTRGSASHKAFPAWMRAIDWSASLVGVDMALNSDCAGYGEFLARMKNDEYCAGAQITSHKVGVFECLSDELDRLDPDARSLGEVGAISMAAGTLTGFSPDMLALTDELTRMLTAGDSAPSPREVIILGGGGAGRAVALTSARFGTGLVPRITITERDATVLADLKIRLSASLASAGQGSLQFREGADNDEIVRNAPAGSLIVNATGRGKDIAGSPVSEDVIFPAESIAWDLNYRGDLRFLHQARAQRASNGVRVLDGWNYFLRNWYVCLQRLAGHEPSEYRFELFCKASEFLRPKAGYLTHPPGARSRAIQGWEQAEGR